MKKYLLVFTGLILSISPIAYAQKKNIQIEKGKQLAASCTNCHGTTQAGIADPLQRIRKVRTADYIYKLIKNPMRFADENKTAKKVFAKRGLQMPAFPGLSKADINAILDYLDSLPYDPKNYSHRKN